MLRTVHLWRYRPLVVFIPTVGKCDEASEMKNDFYAHQVEICCSVIATRVHLSSREMACVCVSARALAVSQ